MKLEAVHGKKKCQMDSWRTIRRSKPYDGQIGDYDVIIDYGACTDPNAINYDPNATFDDGSCEYENTCNGLEASVNIFTDLYASEMSWSI